VRKRQRARA